MRKTLRDVFLDGLRDAYSAEQQWLTALPHMAKAATSRDLTAAFRSQVAETNDQIARLCTIFDGLGAAPEGKVSLPMEALVTESQKLAQQGLESDVLDAALIASAHKITHYDIACYAALWGYADALGETRAAKLLRACLSEQKAFDRALTEIAKGKVNPRASKGG